MRPEIVDWVKIPVQGGAVRFALYAKWDDTWNDVGDRQVPSPIVLELREPDAPTVDLTIEVMAHVPRLVDLRISRQEGGREVRKRDVNLDLEALVEHAVAIASARVIEGGRSAGPLGFPVEQQQAELRRAMKAVQSARGRSQRPMTTSRMERVAEVYRAQDAGGIDAVADAYNVHRATAARWIAKVRAAGLLPPRPGDE